MKGVVFETEHGCTVRCGCCGAHLHLLFRNALMVVDCAQFGQFRASLASFDAQDAVVNTPMGLRVILRASSSASAYLFTSDEFAELRQLVDGTGLMLELDG